MIPKNIEVESIALLTERDYKRIFDKLLHRGKDLETYLLVEDEQKRHNFEYKGVEIALKYSNNWKFHAEFEILVDNVDKVQEAKIKINNIAKELGVKILTPKEIEEIRATIQKKQS